MSQISSSYILSPTIATTFATDAGNAVPALNTLTIAGGTNLNTSGAGSTVTVNLDATITLTGVNATTFDTNVAAAGVTLSGTTLSTDGTDANIDISLATKGTGGLFYDGISTGYADSSWVTKQMGVQTTDATPTAIVSVLVAEGEMVTIKAYVNGFRSTFVDALGGEVLITAYRPTGGNVTQIGEEIINENSTSTATLEASVDVGSQTVNIYVNGVAAQTWNWVSTFNYMFTLTNA